MSMPFSTASLPGSIICETSSSVGVLARQPPISNSLSPTLMLRHPTSRRHLLQLSLSPSAALTKLLLPSTRDFLANGVNPLLRILVPVAVPPTTGLSAAPLHPCPPIPPIPGLPIPKEAGGHKLLPVQWERYVGGKYCDKLSGMYFRPRLPGDH